MQETHGYKKKWLSKSFLHVGYLFILQLIFIFAGISNSSKENKTNRRRHPIQKDEKIWPISKSWICLWRDMADQNINKGDQIRLKNFTVTDCLNRYNNPTSALTNRLSTCSIEVRHEFIYLVKRQL